MKRGERVGLNYGDREDQKAYARMGGWQKTAYYLVAFVTFFSMAVIFFVLCGGLNNIENQLLKDIFLDAYGYPRIWVWFGSGWIIGPVLAGLLVIKTG